MIQLSAYALDFSFLVSILLYAFRIPPTPEETRATGGGITGENVIIVQTAGRDIINRGGGGGGGANVNAMQLQANLVENAIYKRLGPNWLDFTRVDADNARRQIAAEIDTQKTVFQEQELAEILKRRKVADIVIFGTGRMSGSGALYTFRAVNLSDSSILATATAQGPLAGEEVVQEMTVSAVSSLVCEMAQSWSRISLHRLEPG